MNANGIRGRSGETVSSEDRNCADEDLAKAGLRRWRPGLRLYASTVDAAQNPLRLCLFNDSQEDPVEEGCWRESRVEVTYSVLRHLDADEVC